MYVFAAVCGCVRLVVFKCYKFYAAMTHACLLLLLRSNSPTLMVTVMWCELQITVRKRFSVHRRPSAHRAGCIDLTPPESTGPTAGALRSGGSDA